MKNAKLCKAQSIHPSRSLSRRSSRRPRSPSFTHNVKEPINSTNADTPRERPPRGANLQYCKCAIPPARTCRREAVYRCAPRLCKGLNTRVLRGFGEHQTYRAERPTACARPKISEKSTTWVGAFGHPNAARSPRSLGVSRRAFRDRFFLCPNARRPNARPISRRDLCDLCRDASGSRGDRCAHRCQCRFQYRCEDQCCSADLAAEEMPNNCTDITIQDAPAVQAHPRGSSSSNMFPPAAGNSWIHRGHTRRNHARRVYTHRLRQSSRRETHS